MKIEKSKDGTFLSSHLCMEEKQSESGILSNLQIWLGKFKSENSSHMILSLSEIDVDEDIEEDNEPFITAIRFEKSDNQIIRKIAFALLDGADLLESGWPFNNNGAGLKIIVDNEVQKND